MKRTVYWILIATLLILSVGFLKVFGKPMVQSYPSSLKSEKQVYDGDTLQDVRIQILDISEKAAAGGTLARYLFDIKGHHRNSDGYPYQRKS